VFIVAVAEKHSDIYLNAYADGVDGGLACRRPCELGETAVDMALC
jgi:hypothetical protein